MMRYCVSQVCVYTFGVTPCWACGCITVMCFLVVFENREKLALVYAPIQLTMFSWIYRYSIGDDRTDYGVEVLPQLRLRGWA